MTSDRSPSLRRQALRLKLERLGRAPAIALARGKEAAAATREGLAELRAAATPTVRGADARARSLAILAAVGAVALLLWRSARRRTERYRLLSDVLGAIAIVLVVLAVLAALTAGAWPPVLVVESGSMMHPAADTEYGRFGTIDPGDIVLVRPTKGEIQTWAENGKDRYGRPGDVIVFAPDGNRANISVIHRAMAYVELSRDDTGNPTYHLHWTDGQIVSFGREGIYFPPLGFDEDAGFTPARGYKPVYSGFITKGDNAFSNPVADQAGGVSELVDPSWIIGRAAGELPWVGLGKLALQSHTNPAVPGWSRVGNAFAPLELWSCFWILLATVVLVPLSLDTWRWHRRLAGERAREAALMEENRRIRAERAKALEAETAMRVALPAPILSAPRPPPVKKKPATFLPVTRPSPTGAAPAAKKRATFLPVDRETPRDG